MKKYIFILSPPYHGSTILLNLISSSNNVTSFLGSPNIKNKNGEGQMLMDDEFIKNRWDPNYKFSMYKMKSIFDKYWKHSKNIYVEKSPSSICRAKLIENHFKKSGEVYFIILIRSPYSCNWHSDEKYKTDWITCAKYQKYNLENLENKILVTYEELCNNLEETKKKIQNFIPDLGKIEIIANNKNERFNKIHNNKVNRRLGVEWKNYFLRRNIDIVNYFGYNILDKDDNNGCFWKFKDNDSIYWSYETFSFNKNITFSSMEQLNNFKKKLEKSNSYYYHIKVIDNNKNILETINYSNKGRYWKNKNNGTIYWSNSKHKCNNDITFKSGDEYHLHRTHNGFKPNFSNIKSI